MQTPLRIILIATIFFMPLSSIFVASAKAQSAPVPAQSGSGSENEIKTLEMKLADLIVHGDWDGYEKQLASDYNRINADGKLESKQEIIAAFRNGPRKIIVMEPEDLRVRFYAGTAILQGELTTSARESGRVSTKVERFTNVFVQQDGRWLLVSEQTSRAK